MTVIIHSKIDGINSYDTIQGVTRIDYPNDVEYYLRFETLDKSYFFNPNPIIKFEVTKQD